MAGLLEQFRADWGRGVRTNPAKTLVGGEPMSEQLEFLFWVANQRDVVTSHTGPRENPPEQATEAQRSYWDLDEIERAGADMGLTDWDLQAFVANAVTWF